MQGERRREERCAKKKRGGGVNVRGARCRAGWAECLSSCSFFFFFVAVDSTDVGGVWRVTFSSSLLGFFSKLTKHIKHLPCFCLACCCFARALYSISLTFRKIGDHDLFVEDFLFVGKL